MKKTVRKWFWVWQEDKERKFLEEMASKGFRLVDVGFGTYEFEEAEPENLIYQFDFRGIDKIKEDEYLQIYEDAGWRFVSRFGRWYYFAKERGDEESVPAIFSDNESKRARYRRLLVVLIIVGLPLYYQIIIMFPGMPETKLEFPSFYFFARILVAILAVLHILAVWKIMVMYRRMKSYIQE